MKNVLNRLISLKKLLKLTVLTLLSAICISKRRAKLLRLTERIENPMKFWKHNDGDWQSRKLWDDYMKTYEASFKNVIKVHWNIIPADRN
ncbi:MAG: hypothetical protein R2780_10560 [Crocinitomicaceae bacterium]